MEIWINRLLTEKLKKAAETRPVVLITGVRQSGKSSLLQREFKQADTISFDHLNQVEAVTDSPDFFLNQFKDQVILDEVQYVPNLFRELKIQVDKDRKNYGKWILTGSQKFELMEQVSESLAGRISILQLETLSAKELRNSPIKNQTEFIWKGGYPEIWSNPDMDLDDFFESYVRTYIERDLKTIMEVRNLSDFQRFIRVLAARIGQLINYKDISNDVGVSDVTIRKWMHALQISGLVYFLPPFHRNIGKRLTKSAKVFFADHGLVCYLLGIKDLAGWNNHIYKGNLWENLVFMELVKTAHLRPGANLFFYRDQNGVEIDFIVESGNTLYFLEAKAGERIDEKKLSFKKVIPLFEKRYQTKAILLQNLSEPHVLKKKGYHCINPLFADVNL
ncbi:MAG: ATP-binding protein [Deltaproteobacteria bacterium]|nr:ATP-binding protein [Deltaproteobacteria bacterium]